MRPILKMPGQCPHRADRGGESLLETCWCGSMIPSALRGCVLADGARERTSSNRIDTTMPMPSSALPRRLWQAIVVAVLPASLLLAPGGCALNSIADHEVTAAVSRYARERAQAGDAYTRTRAFPAATQPAHRAPASQTAAERAEPRTLRDYIVLALAQNPDIRAAEETAHARAARVPQETALPDPMLMTRTLPEPVRTAEGDNFFYLGVQQRFPVPAKLDHAGRIALQEARMALEDLQRRRLDVIADVKRVYFRIYIIDRTVEVDQANQDLLRGLIDAARAQVAAGRRPQDDVLRAQVELFDLERQLIELRQQRQTAVALLNRTLSRAPSESVATLSEFDARSVAVALETLFTTAAAHNPDLQLLQQQLERDRQRVELAKLAYWPDFTLGFEWMYMQPRDAFVPPPNPRTGMVAPVNRMSESGTDNWAITLSLNLPLWIEKIEGGIREARSQLRASQNAYVAAKNRVSYEIEDALARVRAQQELAALFKDTIIPQAQQAYEVSRVSYAAGATDFLFVIDNWQKWLMFTIQYHRALGELERSVADLEAALGLSLAETGGGA